MFNRKSAILLALTTELVVLELALIFAGSWVDRQLNWPGYGVILGAIGGFSAWVIHLLMALKSFEESDDE